GAGRAHPDRPARAPYRRARALSPGAAGHRAPDRRQRGVPAMIHRPILPLLAAMLLAACAPGPAHEHAGEQGEGEAVEHGPHGGRMLRDGDFAIEVTIFEAGVPPRFRLYATRGGRPLPPSEVNARIELTRLGGAVDTFGFGPEGDYLAGDGIVREPHSFDVRV